MTHDPRPCDGPEPLDPEDRFEEMWNRYQADPDNEPEPAIAPLLPPEAAVDYREALLHIVQIDMERRFRSHSPTSTRRYLIRSAEEYADTFCVLGEPVPFLNLLRSEE